MKRLIGVTLVAVLVASSQAGHVADELDTAAILDKAIKALGGQDRLANAEIVTFKMTHTINGRLVTTTRWIAQGSDRFRVEGASEVNGKRSEVFSVVDGDKGWTKRGDR